MTDSILSVESLTKEFDGLRHPAVDGVGFNLKDNEILSIIGPSGCGKTTLLRLIAGFERPKGGTIKLRDKVISSPKYHQKPEDRDVGMVFQDFALFPHLTVQENIAFGLPDAPCHDLRIEQVLDLVGLNTHRVRYPDQLSGGQQQRVALARSLVVEPSVLLMDEPFSSLDKKLRGQVRQDVKEILKTKGTPTIFVTHDQQEAHFMGDRLAVMRRGQIDQVGQPEEVTVDPNTRFVAHFLGPTEFLSARCKNNHIETPVDSLSPDLVDLPDVPEGEEFDLMVRADDVQFEPVSQAEANGTIVDYEFLGGMNRYEIELSDEDQHIFSLTNHANHVEPGTPVRAEIKPGHELNGFQRPSANREPAAAD